MTKRIVSVFAVLVLLLAVLAGCGSEPTPAATSAPQTSAPEQQPAATEAPPTEPEPPQAVTLNMATAGDTNMVEFFGNEIAPAFNAKFPHITANVVGTGTGDDGSRNIFTKWKAQKDANKDNWDIDVACVNESIMREMIEEGLIEQYVPIIENAQYVNTRAAESCLGTDVKGYVVPLFMSQIVLAYNPEKVTEAPQTFEALEAWIKANPKKFGYNGVTGGMSGVGFTAAWLYYKSGQLDLITGGPYDEANTAEWPAIIKELKDLPVTYTQGNAGTLDMLNRGEIDMGPVWVDMLLLWKSDGRMNPNIRMLLPEPGMPGQPMYMVVAAKGANKEAALEWCNFLADPAVQAEYVVGKYTWHPGVDSVAVFEQCTDEVKELLFSEVTAEEIAAKGLSLPISQYMQDMQRIYNEVR